MKLRILIAEDSELFAAVLQETLAAESNLEVVGMARDGLEAVEMCARLLPDLVMMDIHMPRLDGLSATEKIMAQTPTPILIITSDPRSQGVDLSFKALSAGALDLIAKPTRFPLPDHERKSLLRKVRLLAQIPVVRHVRGTRLQTPTPPGFQPGDATTAPPLAPTIRQAAPPSQPPTRPTPPPTSVIGIVASTGGPRALAQLLADLPADFAASLLIVQHITHGFSAHLATWLNAHSPLTVLEARDGISLQPGHAYIAPTEQHLELTRSNRLRVFQAEPVKGHCPSGDLLLKSIARHAKHAVGIILSGMGDDGTDGIDALYHTGALTLAQDQKSSVIYSMPRSAIARGAITRVTPIESIADELHAHIRAHQQNLQRL